MKFRKEKRRKEREMEEEIKTITMSTKGVEYEEMRETEVLKYTTATEEKEE